MAHVVQAGYRDVERVIRPARVLVSSGSGQEAAESISVDQNTDAAGGDNGI